jgi:hypothetical protein
VSTPDGAGTVTVLTVRVVNAVFTTISSLVVVTVTILITFRSLLVVGAVGVDNFVAEGFGRRRGWRVRRHLRRIQARMRARRDRLQ